MVYVYILRSLSAPSKRYFGITSDLRKRLKDHNAGRSSHTARFAPWQLETYVAFTNKQKAIEFERYLKTGSGRAFSRRRLC